MYIAMMTTTIQSIRVIAERNSSMDRDSTIMTISSDTPRPEPIRENVSGRIIETIIMLSVTMAVTSAARVTSAGSYPIVAMATTIPTGMAIRL